MGAVFLRSAPIFEGGSAMVLHMIGNAHLDPAWFWQWTEGYHEAKATFRSALDRMNEYPDFVFTCSAAAYYEWIEQDEPEMFAEIRRRVQEGRWAIVGGWWIQPDCNAPCGESFARQGLIAQRYFQSRFGMRAHTAYNVDSFGHNGMLPQIFRLSGMENYVFMRPMKHEKSLPANIFLWESADGSRVKAFRIPIAYCTWEPELRERMEECLREMPPEAPAAMGFYGVGNHGGGPTKENIESILRWKDEMQMEFSSPDRFFANVSAEGLPVVRGELFHHASGCYSVHSGVKKWNRQAENALLAAEKWCAIAAKVLGRAYPADDLRRAWKCVLFNQFHDILPGSAIAWVHREAREDYRRDLKRLAEIAQDMCAVLRKANPQADLLAEARISQFRNDGASWHANRINEPTDALSVLTQTLDNGRVLLANGVLSVTIEADGTISSLLDEEHGRELVPAGTRLGRYELLKDEPAVWDAWEIERESLLMANAMTGSIESVDTENGAARVRVRTADDDTVITTIITLRPGSHTLDFHADIDWHERERFLKVALPLGIVADQATYDCQYGLVRRPIVKNTASDEAKYESSTNRFAIIGDAGYAAAVINGSVYGSDASPIAGNAAEGRDSGTMFRLSLLSAPTFPDPRTDIGSHEFDWSVVTDATVDRALGAAGVLNAPVLHDVPDITPLASIESVNGTVVLDWMKLADDGSGDLIVRAYEAAGGQADATLHICPALAGASVHETNVLEGDNLATDLPVALQDGRQNAEGATLHFGPFQLATLRITR